MNNVATQFSWMICNPLRIEIDTATNPLILQPLCNVSKVRRQWKDSESLTSSLELMYFCEVAQIDSSDEPTQTLTFTHNM